MNKLLQAYYTKNENITSYMVNQLKIKSDDIILEPCGGDGDFIDALLNNNKNLIINTCDINKNAVDVMNEKYINYSNISVRQTDVLFDEKFDVYSAEFGYYDKIIGNPPYGAWLDYDIRDRLKKKYLGFYVKETYTLFLLRCIKLLKNNGTLSFIIPDTFLFLTNHSKIRDVILQTCEIQEMLIFPSKLFPGISFQYSNLCIITLKRNNNNVKCLNNNFSIIRGFKSSDQFLTIHNNTNLEKIELNQRDIFNNHNHAFILDNKIANDIKYANMYLSDIADCVTGIYTGDNKRFIVAESENIKGAKGYGIIDKKLIDYNCNNIDGCTEEFKFIPFIKGSPSKKYCSYDNTWYIKWDKDTIDFYNNNKKSRFQNSQYYFRKGIAVPMVKSKQIKATLIRNKVFDQSIVGIFPKDEKYILFILGFLNSNLANEIIHNINPTANNSANYLKKIPIVLPDDKQLKIINEIVNQQLVDYSEQLQDKLNSMFLDIYKS